MIKLRIPTKDQYAFVEVDYEANALGGEEHMKKAYDKLYSLFNSPETSEFAFYAYLIALMDSNLAKWGTADEYAQLNDKQKEVVQSIKRMAKRLKNNE